MASDNAAENFVTLFDSNFLPMGMCLHTSLMEHGQPFHLWILCMDELVEHQLRQLLLPHVTLLPLREVETEALLGVKNGRTRGEYCWTLTPFVPQFVFDRAVNVNRVTYLDADLFFFDSPQILLKELEASGKQVLITEHAYPPEYDQTETSGRFCVQFVTFIRAPGALKVMEWWQARCLEWCFDRFEDGKFGDQKYLDIWPSLFGEYVHVLAQVEKTLAPWNIDYFAGKLGGRAEPVFYHYHGLRIVGPNKVRLYAGYKIGKCGDQIYRAYLEAMSGTLKVLLSHSISPPAIPLKKESFGFVRALKRRISGSTKFGRIAT